jgi:hypothetical protein
LYRKSPHGLTAGADFNVLATLYPYKPLKISNLYKPAEFSTFGLQTLKFSDIMPIVAKECRAGFATNAKERRLKDAS